jgi:hypothetical protein
MGSSLMDVLTSNSYSEREVTSVSTNVYEPRTEARLSERVAVQPLGTGIRELISQRHDISALEAAIRGIRPFQQDEHRRATTPIHY